MTVTFEKVKSDRNEDRIKSDLNNLAMAEENIEDALKDLAALQIEVQKMIKRVESGERIPNGEVYELYRKAQR